MSTYHDSRIRTAAHDYVCGNHLPGRGCGDVIKRGDRYLSFAPGQRGRIPICLTSVKARIDRPNQFVTVEGCAFKTTPAGTSGLKYNCADMIQEIARSEATDDDR